MRDLLLIGGGGHCKAVIDVIEKTGRWRIAGIVDSNPSLSTDLGYPILGTDDDLPRLSREVGDAHITVGQIKTARIRASLFDKLKQLGFAMPALISPLAEVSRRATVGEGTIVMHFGCIGPAAHVGYNTIVNTRALIEHDSVVGSHCHISTGSILNGAVHVGDETFVGSHSVVREGVVIGPRCLVGIGSVVRKDVPADSTFFQGKTQ